MPADVVNHHGVIPVPYPPKSVLEIFKLYVPYDGMYHTERESSSSSSIVCAEGPLDIPLLIVQKISLFLGGFLLDSSVQDERNMPFRAELAARHSLAGNSHCRGHICRNETEPRYEVPKDSLSAV